MNPTQLKLLQIFLILTFISLNAFSQDKVSKDQEKRRNIVENGIEKNFEVNLNQSPSKFKQNINYHWVKGNNIFATMGGGAGKFLDGAYVSFHSNGQLLEKGAFKLGVKTGTWLKWNDQGKIVRQSIYKNGVLKKERIFNDLGNLTEYAKNGRIRDIKIHPDDKAIALKVGKWKRVKTWKEGDKVISKYRSNRPIGNWKTYENGKKVKVVKYKNHQIEEEIHMDEN